MSCTSKILERIIYNKIINFITNSVSNHQFGFLKHRSSIQQLLLLLNTIYNSALTHSPTDVIYLDFKKAFDTVSHPKLLFKLWSAGITGDLWMWFRAYLLDRQQCVTINGQQSSILPVLSGIPQGSILGPLLFIIYINDLPLTINFSHLFLFADDTKCLSPIHSPTESLNLQRDLQAIGTWNDQWCLAFNESKCAHVRFFPNLNSIHTPYFINNLSIPFSNFHKDLVIMSSDLTWNDYFCFITAKAYKFLGIIRRTFTTNSISTKRQLYISLVRSQLTYCSHHLETSSI